MISLTQIDMASKELNTILKGSTVLAVKSYSEKLKKPKRQYNDVNKLVGLRFGKVYRVGKTIVFKLNKLVASCRLGRSAVWMVFYNDEAIPEKNVMMTVYICHNKFAKPIKLVLMDSRDYASIEIRKYEKDCENLRMYGPDPLSSGFDYKWVDFICHKKEIPIKMILGRQEYFAGFNNMIACEVLFRAHIHPLTTAHNLTEEQKKRLLAASRSVFKNHLAKSESVVFGAVENYVFKRADKSCFVCSTKIEKFTLDRYPVYFCPSCQDESWEDYPDVSEDLVIDISKGDFHKNEWNQMGIRKEKK